MKHSNLILAVLAVGLCITLVFAENLESAYAFSVTQLSNGTADVRAIAVKFGEINYAVSDIGTDSVYVRNQNTHALVGSAITGVVDTSFAFTVNTQANRAYFYGGATGIILYEIDLINAVLLRSITTSCSATTQGVYVDVTNGFFYCASATEVISKYSIATFTVSYASSTLNAGATPCDGIEALTYDVDSDTMFAGCSTTANIVTVVNFLTRGTPDFSIAYSATVSSLAFNTRENNLIVANSAAVTPRIYNFTTLSGLTFWKAIATTSESTTANSYSGKLVYHFTSDRYFAVWTTDNISVFDGTTGNSITGFSIGANDGMILVASNTELWGSHPSIAAPNNYYLVDLTGIALGSNGESESGSGTGDLDCTLEENENILICRLGGDGSLVGAGNFIVGNVNGTTGLTPIICATGIVDCVANPDMKTNGVGYLLVTIALAIIIGILWVASRGDLNSIPTFIWFVATLAVVGAFTLMDLIDATFLVITAIIIVALAAAKVRGLFGGEFR